MANAFYTMYMVHSASPAVAMPMPTIPLHVRALTLSSGPQVSWRQPAAALVPTFAGCSAHMTLVDCLVLLPSLLGERLSRRI